MKTLTAATALLGVLLVGQSANWDPVRSGAGDEPANGPVPALSSPVSGSTQAARERHSCGGAHECRPPGLRGLP